MLSSLFGFEASIDDHAGPDGRQTLETRLVDTAAENPEDKLYRKKLVLLVRTALGKLNARQGTGAGTRHPR